jgi:hypothetical protein
LTDGSHALSGLGFLGSLSRGDVPLTRDLPLAIIACLFEAVTAEHLDEKPDEKPFERRGAVQ